MTGKAFHIVIFKDKVVLNWSSQQGVPYRMANDLEKDRLIARILHKILNLRLSAEDGGVLGKDEFRVLGTALFKLLFSDEAFRVQFSTFYREAFGSEKERYRLVLEFDKDADEMAMLPWEYLFYEEKETFLAAHPQKCIDLMRKLPFKSDWLEFDKAALQIDFPLRVLIIAANPDTSLKLADFDQMLAYFENLPKRFTGQIEVQVIRQPDLDTFEQELKKSNQTGFPHVIHFLGRGRMEGANGQVCFVKPNADGKFSENWVSDDVFAGYFEEWRQLPHLVVLHICDGSPIRNYKEDRGTAIRLAKKGVPFVLFLQNPVPDWMAKTLMEKLYESLLAGYDLTAALTEARFFLARKLKDENDRQYDNYEHKVFGSAVLFSTVLQPFIVGKTEIEEVSTPSAANTTIHPLRTMQVDASRSATAASSVAMQGDHTRVQVSSTTVEAKRVLSNQELIDIEQQGLRKQLEELIKELNFYRDKSSKISDIGQLFKAQQDMEALEAEIETLKQQLGITRSDRAG